MGSLFHVCVEALGEDWVDFGVVAEHPDVGGVPCDETFALRLLFEPILRHGHALRPEVLNAPLAIEMDRWDHYNEAFVSENARGFIAAITMRHSGDSNAPSKQTLHVSVTHPGWVAHLSTGMAWDSASYGTRDAAAWDKPPRRPGQWRSEVSHDPLEGMSVRPHDEQVQLHVGGRPCAQYILPVFGPSHYVSRQTVEGDAVTEEVLQALLGQPVLALADRGRVIGSLVKAEGGWVNLYHESNGRVETTNLLLSSIERAGRAWYVRRVPIDASSNTRPEPHE